MNSIPAITDERIAEAQAAWGEGVVAIGQAYAAGEDYERVAQQRIRTLYDYERGEVLFKPTRASDHPFRLSEEGAVSYFVGGNPAFSEDKGFALQPWTEVRFENAGTVLRPSYAVALGNYFFTSPEGDELKAEYTFGYAPDADGRLRISLHHSSLPFEGT